MYTTSFHSIFRLLQFSVLILQFVHFFVSLPVSKKDLDFEESVSGILLIAGVAGGVVSALLISLLAVLILRRRTRRTRAENLIDRVPIRIINPSKKNSLNRRNDAGAVMRIEKQKMLERGDEEEDEEDEIDFISAKCNLNNFRNRELRGNPFKGKLVGILLLCGFDKNHNASKQLKIFGIIMIFACDSTRLDFGCSGHH